MKGKAGPAALVLGAALLFAAGCSSSGSGGGDASATSSGPGVQSATASAPAGRVPAPAHTVVVMMENHAFSEVIGNSAAPYLNQLAQQGALFTHSYAITHPSEPNYLALFSGSTHGVLADSCPVELTAPNLAADLIT